eukprot:scaffold23061_cov116-Isochrysis_galbana.AAC.1
MAIMGMGKGSESKRVVRHGVSRRVAANPDPGPSFHPRAAPDYEYTNAGCGRKEGVRQGEKLTSHKDVHTR